MMCLRHDYMDQPLGVSPRLPEKTGGKRPPADSMG